MKKSFLPAADALTKSSLFCWMRRLYSKSMVPHPVLFFISLKLLHIMLHNIKVHHDQII